MQASDFSYSALSLSVLTAVLGECILSEKMPPARVFLVQGLCMAAGMALLLILLKTAMIRADSLSGKGFQSKLVCGGMALWVGLELWDAVRSAQTVCREQFSSMAVLGVLPLLLWAGWQLRGAVFSRSAGVLWWAVLLAGLLCLFSLNGQLHWENLMRPAGPVSHLQFPLFAEWFLIPVEPDTSGRSFRRLWFLPFQVLLVQGGFALGMELLFGAGTGFPGYELLRAGMIGSISRFDAAFLLVWLLLALFRICFLVCILRELLRRIGRTGEVPA